MKNLNEMLNDSLNNVNESLDNNTYKLATNYAKKFVIYNELGVLHSLYTNHVDNDMDLEETLEEMNWGKDENEKAFAAVFIDLLDKFPDFYNEGDSMDIFKALKDNRKIVKSASALYKEYDMMIVISLLKGMSPTEKKFLDVLMPEISNSNYNNYD